MSVLRKCKVQLERPGLNSILITRSMLAIKQ